VDELARRGDFWREFNKIAQEHGFDQECKWSHASAAKFLPFYKELISYFFLKTVAAFPVLGCKEAGRREGPDLLRPCELDPMVYEDSQGGSARHSLQKPYRKLRKGIAFPHCAAA
jgi:hypothetical protein